MVFNSEFNQTECAIMAGYKNRPRQNASNLKILSSSGDTIHGKAKKKT